MKKVILSLAIIVAALGTQAQEKEAGSTQFGLGVTVALPLGDFGDAAGIGFGPKVQAEHMFTENVSGLASIGYNFFTKKDGAPKSFSTIPIQVGGRYHFTGGFFVGAEVGYMMSKYNGENYGGFAYNPHIGYDLSKLQLALGYQATSKDGFTTSYLGLSGIVKF